MYDKITYQTHKLVLDKVQAGFYLESYQRI